MRSVDPQLGGFLNKGEVRLIEKCYIGPEEYFYYIFFRI